MCSTEAEPCQVPPRRPSRWQRQVADPGRDIAVDGEPELALNGGLNGPDIGVSGDGERLGWVLHEPVMRAETAGTATREAAPLKPRHASGLGEHVVEILVAPVCGP